MKEHIKKKLYINQNKICPYIGCNKVETMLFYLSLQMGYPVGTYGCNKVVMTLLQPNLLEIRL